jgi:hypothetical protein
MKEENIQEICSSYPDQWVLVGNPKMRDDHFTGSVAEQVLSGFVVFNSKDKREIALRMKELKKDFTKTACFYTGNILVGKRFWL